MIYGEPNMKDKEIKKLNIMYIWNDTTFGGATQSLLDTLVEIKKKINPVVIMHDAVDDEEVFKKLDIRYYKIHFELNYTKIGNGNEEKRKFDKIQSYNAALQLNKLIEKEKIDLIHINSSVSYFGALAAMMSHIPYVWHIRELLEEQFGCEFLNDELMKKLFTRADKLIAISDFVQNKYQEKYHINTVRIYNGLNITKYKKKLNDNRKYNNDFLVVGNVSPGKGQWDVIRATEILVKKGYCNINIIIAGDGDSGYLWALKKYISKNNLNGNIHILPFISDLSKLRSGMSYAISCSKNEALGRVTIEAMLAGNLVIGSRSGATEEIIGRNEERGFLYELGNVNELADTMMRVMQCSDDIKNTVVKAAQIYAENIFDSKPYCRKLLKIYNEAIAEFIPGKYDMFINNLRNYSDSDQYASEFLLKESNIVANKARAAYRLTAKWLEIKKKGHSLIEFFENNHFQSIAIYGMAELGRRLYDELDESGVEIKYLIDKSPNGMENILNFTLLDGRRLDVDVIVVTVASAEKQIVSELQESGYRKVIGLSDIMAAFE